MNISPLNQRRIANFKANKRGYYSLWLFSILFIFSLFAEFWANDKPLLVSYKDTWYYPVIKDYSETTFGGLRKTKKKPQIQNANSVTMSNANWSHCRKKLPH